MIRPVLLAVLASAAVGADEPLTADQAVALALSHNRDAIAARLDVEAAEIDRVAAGVYPNPVLSYTVGNIVVGRANDQGTGVRPGPFDQTQQTIAISEILDVWAKRSARLKAAGAGIEHRRLLVEAALREIVHSVRGSVMDLLREQLERDLAVETEGRHGEVLRISRARHAAGDISEAELRKVELEGLRYRTATIDAEMELDLARQRLAALLGSSDPGAPLPSVTVPPLPARLGLGVDELVNRAMRDRPDARAARLAHVAAAAQLGLARREALPDISVGLAFTHSEFQVSGDNPNSLALTVALPLPIFDRNQAAIARAHLEQRRADNDEARLRVQVRREVEGALRRATRARALVDVYEGGMLARADAALQVAVRSYQSGALSLLELLEAQRTNLETHAGFVRAQHDLRQAVVDVSHAIGGEPG